MCQTRFDSQGMILNDFKKKHFRKNVNDTRDPYPFMANAIKDFNIFFKTSPLVFEH